MSHETTLKQLGITRAEVEGAWHCANIGAAPEKYQFCTNTAPARGSAEAANPTEGGFIGGVTKSLRRAWFEIGGNPKSVKGLWAKKAPVANAGAFVFASEVP